MPPTTPIRARDERARALRNLDALIHDLMAREIEALRSALEAINESMTSFHRGRADGFRRAQIDLRTLRGRLFVDK